MISLFHFLQQEDPDLLAKQRCWLSPLGMLSKELRVIWINLIIYTPKENQRCSRKQDVFNQDVFTLIMTLLRLKHRHDNHCNCLEDAVHNYSLIILKLGHWKSHCSKHLHEICYFLWLESKKVSVSVSTITRGAALSVHMKQCKALLFLFWVLLT